METPLFINPYDILEVASTASEVEITKAFALAMKRRKYSVDAIAKARKSLMNPEERVLADYLKPILPMIQRFKHQDIVEKNNPKIQINFFTDFDSLESHLSKVNQASEIDSRLGEALFSSSPITLAHLIS
jgi:hypothetical protein